MVIQCGGDCLIGDPLGGANVTPGDLVKCVKFVLQRNLPTVILGGGGYNFKNTAKYWTLLTAAVLNETIPNDIPEDCECFLDFGPDYTLNLEESSVVKDYNTEDEYEKNVENIFRILEFCE